MFFNQMKRWRVERKEHQDERTLLDSRVMLMRLIVFVAFFALIAQLWRMQIVEGSQYQQRAEANRLRVTTILPSRGVIYDREGRLLVSNEPAFTVAAVVADLPEDAQRQVIRKLEGLLKVPAPDLERSIQERRDSGQIFTPVALKTGLDRETAFVLEEHHWELPGITVLTESRRVYINEGDLSHILGYVGRISPEEYAALRNRGYDLNDTVGKMGVEFSYEEKLRGKPGREQVEVDVTGRKRRALVSVPPTPGSDIVLSIDLDLQKEMVRLLQQGMGDSSFGAAIAMDPRNGEILGMVSLPAFDNNLFGGPIEPETLEKLLGDSRRPLMNYATGGTYPPGSIFKVVTGSGALQEGIAGPNTVIESRGLITVPNQYNPNIIYKFYDWAVLGRLNFYRAIAMSSDVYFYHLAGGYGDFKGLGIERLAGYAKMFGLGALTGIDLPGEAAGAVPDPEWKLKTFDEPWVTGDTYNFGIGQGFLLATPIQMVRVVSAIANNGELLQPHVVKELRDADGKVVRRYDKVVQRRLAVSEENLQVIREGMRQVVADGTAPQAQVPGVEVAGKTGTAEFGIPQGDGPRQVSKTHGWFIGFAPVKQPKIAVVVFYERGNGALNSAPTAGKIMSYFLNKNS